MACDHMQTVPGTGGEAYVPMSERAGAESTVYFTRDLSAEGLRKIFERVNAGMTGKVAIKLHTGEQNGPNIIPRPWVKSLIETDLPGATIVETNTFYKGDRYTTEQHRKTLEVNGWTFCPVDIMDEDGVTTFPVEGGKWFHEMHVGKNLANYDSLFVLTHFKGHAMGDFGGSAKNIGIVASTDILAADQASVDLVYALSEADHHDLVERMESRHGLRQLSYMKELGMGNDRYKLLDIDNDDAEISPADAVQGVVPFEE